MTFPVFDTFKQASELLCDHFTFKKTMLAALLGVTERSLSEWEKLPVGDATPKSKRLKLLYELVRYVQVEFPDLSPMEIRDVLENSSVVFDPDDLEDGYISLIDMVVTDPDEKFWPQIAKGSVNDYLKLTGRERQVATDRRLLEA